MATPASPLAQNTSMDEVADSFWRSLHYFNCYRIAVAAVFLVAVLIYRDELNLGSHNLKLFDYVSAAYLCAAVVYQVLLSKWKVWFNGQLTAQVLTDIVMLVLLMNASSGIRSGLGVMLLVSLAGAALVSRGTLMLFYAAVASIAVLIEQAYWVLTEDHATAGFLQPGMLSIGYFATALITNQLAQRIITNERVARQRGADLANQLRINQLVIQDIQDGVMVVDANGLVRLHNRQVAGLLGHGAPELDQIERYSEDVGRHLAAWRAGAGPAAVSVRFPESGKLVRVRYVAAGLGGDSLALVFLEDLSRQQEQAQQLKLAALGRLTANIAHEIRNPLSAITHASDLLREEHQGDPKGGSTDRLVEIIHENSRRLDRMVKDVLELSRRDRIQPEDIPLASHIEAFVDDFARNEGVPRDCFVVEAQATASIEFDRTHLNQVLWNLVRNAWRHCRKAARSVRIAIAENAGQVELHVLDDGGGVPRELQAQLFEPFFTTFSSGTGLGLYIAKELCAANRATLEYLDGAGGADFRILWRRAR